MVEAQPCRSGRWLRVAAIAGAIAISFGAHNYLSAQATSSPAAPQQASAKDDPNYVIGAGDSLSISVWKEPDLTSTIPVRPDGKISVPLLNDVQASGLTPMELSSSLTEKLKKYLADPRVTVIVTTVNVKRIFVLGEVQHTGPMALLPNMTVLQALSESGFSQFANTKKIYVLRNDQNKEVKIPFDYKKALKGSIAQNIILKPGDTIVVP